MVLFGVGGKGGPDVFCLVETIVAKLRSNEHEQRQFQYYTARAIYGRLR